MRTVQLLFFALTISINAGAMDWPQFRFGSNRGASSPEGLPVKLHLQWSREFATPSPAFPGEVRLRYDAGDAYPDTVIKMDDFLNSLGWLKGEPTIKKESK